VVEAHAERDLLAADLGHLLHRGVHGDRAVGGRVGGGDKDHHLVAGALDDPTAAGLGCLGERLAAAGDRLLGEGVARAVAQARRADQVGKDDGCLAVFVGQGFLQSL
jgi:hypothetical protein